MIKNIKRLALLLVAAAALLNVSCKKEDEIMKLDGTTWRFYYEGDIAGMELIMNDQIHVLSADSVHRRAYFVFMGDTIADAEETMPYTWDGLTLTLLVDADNTMQLTYRANDNVFFRVPDQNDEETLQIMQMLGLTEFVYIKQ